MRYTVLLLDISDVFDVSFVSIDSLCCNRLTDQQRSIILTAGQPAKTLFLVLVSCRRVSPPVGPRWCVLRVVVSYCCTLLDRRTENPSPRWLSDNYLLYSRTIFFVLSFSQLYDMSPVGSRPRNLPTGVVSAGKRRDISTKSPPSASCWCPIIVR